MSQFTKLAIIKTFVDLLNERPFDKITVTDIVERCGINRNTFYYYYQDIYALIDDIFRTETQKIVQEHATYDTWQEGFMQAIRFAYANKTAIYHIYNSISRDWLEKYLYDVVYSSMEGYIRLKAEGLTVQEEDIRALAVFYTTSLIGIVLKWLRDGMKFDPEESIGEIGNLFDDVIRYTLERCSRCYPAGKNGDSTKVPSKPQN